MATYKLKTYNNDLTAVIIITDDGLPPLESDIHTFLKNNGIVYGIKKDTIKEICMLPKFNVEIPVAYGIAPGTGTPGQFKILVHLEKRDTGTSEKIDMREYSTILLVEENTILAKIIAPELGKEGMDVYGNKLEGLPGKPVKINPGKNVKTEEDTIVSNVSGKLFFKHEVDGSYFIDILQIHSIDGDVDYSTGNIKFPGDVEINGNVKPGFVVHAGGNIKVKGLIESATVISEQTIEVYGIKGGGKGIVKAKEIHANYIENADIEVSTNLIVKKYIINSNVNAGEKVIVEDLANGKIIGGNITAGVSIEASIFGSQISAMTNLEVGIRPEISEEITILNTQVMLDMENLKKLTGYLKGFVKLQQEGKIDSEQLEKYKKSVDIAKNLKETIEINKNRLHEIQKILTGQGMNGVIIARYIIYPGTEVKIKKHVFSPAKPITKVIFRVVDEQIVMTGYSPNS